jgi:hypothetical protein
MALVLKETNVWPQNETEILNNSPVSFVALVPKILPDNKVSCNEIE